MANCGLGSKFVMEGYFHGKTTQLDHDINTWDEFFSSSSTRVKGWGGGWVVLERITKEE